MALQINTDARPDEVEEVFFGDDGPYEFVTPKIAPLIAAMRKLQYDQSDEAGMVALEAQDRWLRNGFGEEQWERIQERLDDDDDPLDFWHLEQVFEALFQQVSGRPPTSPGGLSRTSRTRPSGARQKRSASTRTISRQDEPATSSSGG